MFKHIKKNFKKSTAFVLIFALCCGIMVTYSPNTAVYAATTAAELEAKMKAIDERNAEIDALLANIDGDLESSKEYRDLYFEKLSAKKEMVDYYNNLIYYKEEEIAVKESDIAKLEAENKSKEAEITQKKLDIDNLQAENDENLKKFGEMMRAMYITGNVDFASVMAQSKDFYDMLVRTKMLANISEQSMDFMDSLNASIDQANKDIVQIKQDQAVLDDKIAVLNDEKKKLDEEKAELELLRDEAKTLEASYMSDYDTYDAIVSNLEGQQEDLGNEKEANQADKEAYEAQIAELIRQEQEGSDEVYQDGDWLWPLERKFHYITTYFGYDAWRGGNHSGIDVGNAGINGTNIYASKSGTVIVAKTSYTPGYSYGKYVVIDHGDSYSTLYAHCSDIYVSVGQQVSQGDAIAAVGSTGWSTGAHLHFEVRLDGKAQDPFSYVTKPTD